MFKTSFHGMLKSGPLIDPLIGWTPMVTTFKTQNSFVYNFLNTCVLILLQIQQRQGQGDKTFSCILFPLSWSNQDMSNWSSFSFKGFYSIGVVFTELA